MTCNDMYLTKTEHTLTVRGENKGTKIAYLNTQNSK